MGEAKENDVYKQELLDHDEDEDRAVAKPAARQAAAKKGNVSSHSSGFADFFLKPELLRPIQDCGLETRTNAWSNGPLKFLFDGRATPARPLECEEADNKAVDASAKPASRHAAPKKGCVGIHSSGFRDFILTPELLRAIQKFSLEHP